MTLSDLWPTIVLNIFVANKVLSLSLSLSLSYYIAENSVTRPQNHCLRSSHPILNRLRPLNSLLFSDNSLAAAAAWNNDYGSSDRIRKSHGLADFSVRLSFIVRRTHAPVVWKSAERSASRHNLPRRRHRHLGYTHSPPAAVNRLWTYNLVFLLLATYILLIIAVLPHEQ